MGQDGMKRYVPWMGKRRWLRSVRRGRRVSGSGCRRGRTRRRSRGLVCRARMEKKKANVHYGVRTDLCGVAGEAYEAGWWLLQAAPSWRQDRDWRHILNRFSQWTTRIESFTLQPCHVLWEYPVG